MLSGSEIADYYLYTLNHIKRVAGAVDVADDASQASSKSRATKAKQSRRQPAAPLAAKARRRQPQQPAEAPVEAAPSSHGQKHASAKPELKPLSLYTPSLESYRRMPHTNVVNCFENADLAHKVRVGDYTDKDTTPAAIAFPDCLYSGEEQLVNQ
jgi:hypothetical protein